MTHKNSILSDPELLAALMKTMNDGVALSHEEGRFEIYNQKMETITGYTRAAAGTLGELLALLYQDLVQYRFAMSVVSEIYQRNCRERETVIRAKDGSLKTLLVSTSHIELHNEKFYLSVCRDITVDQENVLVKTKPLNGLLPICATCKKIRDERGAWHRIETYISEHSDAFFSHGICPDCATRDYPKYFNGGTKERN